MTTLEVASKPLPSLVPVRLSANKAKANLDTLNRRDGGGGGGGRDYHFEDSTGEPGGGGFSFSNPESIFSEFLRGQSGMGEGSSEGFVGDFYGGGLYPRQSPGSAIPFSRIESLYESSVNSRARDSEGSSSPFEMRSGTVSVETMGGGVKAYPRPVFRDHDLQRLSGGSQLSYTEYESSRSSTRQPLPPYLARIPNDPAALQPSSGNRNSEGSPEDSAGGAFRIQSEAYYARLIRDQGEALQMEEQYQPASRRDNRPFPQSMEDIAGQGQQQRHRPRPRRIQRQTSSRESRELDEMLLNKAIAYQESNSAPTIPLTAEVLRRAQRRPRGSSRSTKSSGSRDEDDYQRTETSFNSGDEDMDVYVSRQRRANIVGKRAGHDALDQARKAFDDEITDEIPPSDEAANNLHVLMKDLSKPSKCTLVISSTISKDNTQGDSVRNAMLLANLAQRHRRMPFRGGTGRIWLDRPGRRYCLTSDTDFDTKELEPRNLYETASGSTEESEADTFVIGDNRYTIVTSTDGKSAARTVKELRLIPRRTTITEKPGMWEGVL